MALKQSSYLCIICKTPKTAYNHQSAALRWVSSKLASIHPKHHLSVVLQDSNDFYDKDLQNDIIFLLKSGAIGGFSLESAKEALVDPPTFVASVQTTCVSDEYVQAVLGIRGS